MPVIEHLSAMEILDSRGRPTISAACRLRGGQTVTASVPSGASTGAAEALELRDGDSKRYGGLGCRKAVSHVNGEIAKALVKRDFPDQASLDRAMLDLDGTPNKSRLGANAILAVSIAFARACADAANVPLYAHFARLAGRKPDSLPRLTVNLFSGGKHAGGQVEFQDILIVPSSAKTIDESFGSNEFLLKSMFGEVEKFSARKDFTTNGFASRDYDMELKAGGKVRALIVVNEFATYEALIGVTQDNLEIIVQKKLDFKSISDKFIGSVEILKK